MDALKLETKATAHKDLLTENEAIETLGLKDRPNPKGALRWLMRTKKLAYVPLTRGVYGFKPSDLSACIEANGVPAVENTRRPGPNP